MHTMWRAYRAATPSMSLLDEPAAGLDLVSRQKVSRLIRGLVDKWGITVVLIEHNAPMILSTRDRVLAMASGVEIVHGSAVHIRSHPDVIRAYLGSSSLDDSPVGSGHRAGQAGQAAI